MFTDFTPIYFNRGSFCVYVINSYAFTEKCKTFTTIQLKYKTGL